MISAALLTATSLATAPLDARLLRWPTVHGSTVVFTYAGDLWTCDLTGGVARRLTSFPGLESRARFSPDGQTIAFSGQIDGGTDVYTIPAEGGEPTRISYDPAGDNMVGWTPDGKIGYASAWGNTFTQRLWITKPTGGLPSWTKLNEITDGSFSPDGRSIAFTRMGSHNFNWRKYRGGTQGRISFFNLDTAAYSEIPGGREQSYHPMWVGGDVYYISDKDRKAINLYKYSTGSRKIEQMTKNADGDIRWPSTDGKSIVWERLGKVEVFDIASGKVSSFSPRVLTDGRSTRPRWRSFANQINDMALSPSGKRLVVEARGDLYSLPASTGQTRALTTGQASREKDAQWSPDGQTVAYLSDQSGEWQIMVQPQMGGEAKAIKTPSDHRIRSFTWSTSGKYILYVTFDATLYIMPAGGGEPKKVFQDAYAEPGGFDISPDDSWIVYSATQKNMFHKLFAYNVDSGKTTALSTGFYNDSSPTFDLSGKYVYFVSSRTYGYVGDEFQGPGINQADTQRIYVLPLQKSDADVLDPASDEEPVKAEAPKGEAPKPEAEGGKSGTKIDFDGIANRAIALPLPNSGYPFVIGGNNSVFTFTNGALTQFSLASKQAAPIIAGATGFSFNANRSKIAYRAGQVIGIIDARPGNAVGAGRVDASAVGTMWDPRAEYKQMFWEVWRWERDVFYDPNMVGLDWKAIGEKYAAILPSVGDRTDLNYLFGQLIGELGTGHAYVSGGETEVSPGAPVATLGADYEPAGDSVRITRILEGSSDESEAKGPLLGKDVKAGDYLISIDGQAVTAETGVSQFLTGKIGRQIVIEVNDRPSRAGARKVTVVGGGNEQALRYETWVSERRALVDKLSGGKVGYMHVPNTSFEGIVGFVKGYYSQSDKEAWLIDERFNGGGFIPTFFLDALTRQVDSAFQGRYGQPFSLPTQALVGPKAMLINNYAGSGGDMFPWLFQNRKVGPLYGTRTWGGLVGIQGGVPLVDGGSVTAPGFGIFDSERGQWIAENKGVDPDVEIDNTPEVIAKGQDLQLEKAVEYLLGEIKKGKGAKPIKTPAFPRRDP